tara:strand:- start:618 stop:1757 length:1140 start_codon:yes stop_codon:yes gene_type:complete
MKLLKTKLTSILLCLVLSCDDYSKKTSTVRELEMSKKILIRQIDSLGILLKEVEQNISKLDTNKRLLMVTALNTKKKKFEHYIDVQGIVESDESVELFPEQGGTVSNIYVKEGQRVKRGQTLIQIDDSLIKSTIAETQTQLDLATTTFKRQKRLWNQNIGSEIQYLQSKAKKEGLENKIKSLKVQARKLKIVAPFTGTIDEVFNKIGGLATPLFPSVRVINLERIHVESEVTETYLKTIATGTKVELFFPSLGNKIKAKINQVGNFINPDNRSFKIRIDIKNKDNELKPNLLADLKINDFEETGIVIPSKLIQKDRLGNSFVYTLQKVKDNYNVEKSYIKEKMTYNNESFISEGLNEDVLVVDKGSRLIKEGEIVILSE